MFKLIPSAIVCLFLTGCLPERTITRTITGVDGKTVNITASLSEINQYQRISDIFYCPEKKTYTLHYSIENL